MRPLALAAILLPLAACGQAPATSKDPRPPGPDPLASLSPAQRNATLLRAVRDAGQPCQRVEESSASGKRTWLAVCENGVNWVVVIGADGSAQVTDARDFAEASRTTA